METKPKSFSEAIDKVQKSLNGHGGEVKERLEAEIKKLEEKLDDLKERAGEEAAKVKAKVETQVQEHPWAAVGIVGLIFLVLGVILGLSSRRKSD